MAIAIYTVTLSEYTIKEALAISFYSYPASKS